MLLGWSLTRSATKNSLVRGHHFDRGRSLMRVHPDHHCDHTVLLVATASLSNRAGTATSSTRALEYAGKDSERIHAVAAWREALYFSDAERAALALTEAVTRLADRPDPVPDEIWDEAARHYSEPQLAALVVAIATINAFNRLNAATRQISGTWVARIVQPVSQPG